MKQLRLLSIALSIVAFCSWSVVTHACDQNKAQTTAASAASMKAGGASVCTGKASATTADYRSAAAHGCPAAMAAGCTESMAASCPMKGVNTAARTVDFTATCCAAHGENATAANAGAAGCPFHAMKNSAMAAGAEGCSAHMKNSAMAAGAEGCSAHMKNSAMAAGAEGCSAHMKNSAMAAGARGTCAAHGTKASNYTAHADCDGCAEFMACDQALRDMGAVLQVVSLKNGVMFVYTSDPLKVRALQATMAQREDQMAIFASATSGAHLCDGCKQLRGAALSGKLTREVVNIEGGCLSLLTSSDPAVVARIHAMAGVTAARAKI